MQFLKKFKKKKPESANALRPHDAIPVVHYNRKPHIYVTFEAYQNMCTLIDLIQDEVGWQGTVEIDGDNYYIKEIFIMGQEVHGTTTILTTDGQSELAMELFDNRSDEAMDLLNSLRFWGHSHVWMGVSPSQRDNDQMQEFKNGGAEYFIRGIGNKHGKMVYDLYLYKEGLMIHDVPWSIIYPEEEETVRQKWIDELEKKVKHL